ncbi:MAG: retropepsin-like aspartic protease [Microcoleaceae cyanobacterium]
MMNPYLMASVWGVFLVTSFPLLAQETPKRLAPVSQEMMQEITDCVIKKVANPQKPTPEELQSSAMECVIRVVILDKNGKIRPDANQRMTTLIKSTGISLPKTQSQGESTLKLEPLTKSNLFTIPVKIGETHQKFILDTGASNSIIDSKIAEALGLKGNRIPSDILAYFVVGNNCSQVTATVHSLPPLSVNQAQVKGMNGMGLPKTSIPGEASGVLGLDFLKNFDVIINPQTLELKLLPPKPIVSGGIPLKGTLGVMTTEVKINGVGPFKFLLDTGADSMVLSNRLVGKLSLNTAQAKNIDVKGFCGNEPGKQITLDRVTLGQNEVKKLDSVILENKTLDILGVDGIIGQNFLNHYQQHWQFGPANELGFPETGSLTLTPLTNH